MECILIIKNINQVLTKHVLHVKILKEGGIKYKICPDCKCKLMLELFDKHMELQHQKIITKKKKTQIKRAIIKCPRCKCNVTSKNLKKHLKRIHGEVQVKKKPIIRDKLTVQDAVELKKIISDKYFYKNKEINLYLNKNPIKESYGKFGVPQDKYRWGCFGGAAMEFDAWSKNDNKQ